MKKTSHILLLFAFISLCQAAESVKNSENSGKPNILFVLVDDFGWKDVGYNGSTFYETPRIDQLSKEWMRFDRSYTPSPMCSPTRVSILTGKNPARHGVTQWLIGSDKFYGRDGEQPNVYCPLPQAAGIRKSEVTLGEAFQEAGYRTGFYGKWHMGSFKITGGPEKHGYETTKAVIQANNCRIDRPKRYFKNAKPGNTYTDEITDAAISFVTDKHEEPFYLHLCYFAMHAKIYAKPEHLKKFETKAKKMGIPANKLIHDPYSHKAYNSFQGEPEYAGELYNLDANIGRLIDALKKNNLYENTIIVLTGDNGGRSSFFHSPPTSNSPLRAGKTFLFEGGLLTPTLIHWPGRSKAGMQTKTPITSMDFYPTLLDMTGIKQKPKQHVDGVSLTPLFDEKKLKRDTLFWHFPHHQGEGSYPSSAMRKGTYKLIRNYHQGDLLLYNLEDDPYENKNLAVSMPKKAKKLNRELTRFLKKTGSIIPQPIDYK